DILIEGNIVGNIHYLNRSPIISEKAFVGGELVKTNIPDMKDIEQELRLHTIIAKVLHSLSLILIFILIMRFFPNKFKKTFEQYKNNISKNILLGFLAMLIFPI